MKMNAALKDNPPFQQLNSILALIRHDTASVADGRIGWLEVVVGASRSALRNIRLKNGDDMLTGCANHAHADILAWLA
jgi:hypothetical protein